jgi:hypothetical protein
MNMFGCLWRERPLDGACPPPNTRRFNFYLTARSHDTKCDYVASYDGDQRRIDPVKTLGVSLNFTELAEGDLPAEPTISSTFEYGFPSGSSDLAHFLQAVSDCAASMGIYPSGAKDTTKEL